MVHHIQSIHDLAASGSFGKLASQYQSDAQNSFLKSQEIGDQHPQNVNPRVFRMCDTGFMQRIVEIFLMSLMSLMLPISLPSACSAGHHGKGYPANCGTCFLWKRRSWSKNMVPAPVRAPAFVMIQLCVHDVQVWKLCVCSDSTWILCWRKALKHCNCCQKMSMSDALPAFRRICVTKIASNCFFLRHLFDTKQRDQSKVIAGTFCATTKHRHKKAWCQHWQEDVHKC